MSTAAEPRECPEPERVVVLAAQLARTVPETAPLLAIIIESYIEALISLLDDYHQLEAAAVGISTAHNRDVASSTDG